MQATVETKKTAKPRELETTTAETGMTELQRTRETQAAVVTLQNQIQKYEAEKKKNDSEMELTKSEHRQTMLALEATHAQLKEIRKDYEAQRHEFETFKVDRGQRESLTAQKYLERETQSRTAGNRQLKIASIGLLNGTLTKRSMLSLSRAVRQWLAHHQAEALTKPLQQTTESLRQANERLTRKNHDLMTTFEKEKRELVELLDTKELQNREDQESRKRSYEKGELEMQVIQNQREIAHQNMLSALQSELEGTRKELEASQADCNDAKHRLVRLQASKVMVEKDLESTREFMKEPIQKVESFEVNITYHLTFSTFLLGKGGQ